MSGRVIAVGDIHGCGQALAALLAAIEPATGDEIIVLGDFIDRGPDSHGVIEQLLALSGQCRLIWLLGNHEEMLLQARSDPSPGTLQFWLRNGGAATLDAYGFGTRPEDLPREHVEFIERSVPFHEIETHAFLHANYDANAPFPLQTPFRLRWESLRDRIPPRHISGKTVVLGHTPQPEGRILDRGYLLCIDTGCYCGGWLSALEVASRQAWQANQQGEVRQFKLEQS